MNMNNFKNKNRNYYKLLKKFTYFLLLFAFFIIYLLELVKIAIRFNQGELVRLFYFRYIFLSALIILIWINFYFIILKMMLKQNIFFLLIGLILIYEIFILVFTITIYNIHTDSDITLFILNLILVIGLLFMIKDDVKYETKPQISLKK